MLGDWPPQPTVFLGFLSDREPDPRCLSAWNSFLLRVATESVESLYGKLKKNRIMYFTSRHSGFNFFLVLSDFLQDCRIQLTK